MKMQQSLFSLLLISIITLFYSTTLAQLSPVQQPPVTSPSPPLSPVTTPPAPGFNTVPLVPVSPNGAPTPTIPKVPSIDITQILQKAKRFSILIRLLKTTQLINQLNSQLVTSGSSGLTLFAPEDSAFSKLKAGFLNSLSDRKKVELLQFHTLSSFISITNFDTLTNPVQTQAGDDAKRLQLNVTTFGGNQVSMTTGAVNASITGTVYADNKLAIYQVDKVLIPLDFVLPNKAPAPSPAAVKGGSSFDGKTKAKSSDGGGDSDGEDKALPAEEASGGASLKVEGLWWVTLFLGVVLVLAGEAIL